MIFILLKRLIGAYHTCFSKLYVLMFSIIGVKIDQTVKFRGIPHIFSKTKGAINIGKRCKIISSQTANPIGLNHKCIIRALTNDSQIKVGDDVGISGSTLLARKSISIGDNTLIGANCTITDSDHHPVDADERLNSRSEKIQSAPIVIGNNVWIGGNVMILKGVTIGKNSVVGAGSIVVSDIPENVIAAGNPARVIREINID